MTINDKLNRPIARFGKNQRAHTFAKTFGWVRSVYPNAIEYTVGPQGLRGLVLVISMIGALIAFGFGTWRMIVDVPRFSGDFLDAIMLPLPFIFVGLGFYFVLKGIRLDLFRPIDEPTIFDRKNRKVYRVLRDVHPGLRGLFRRWPLRYACYDWDLIDAQHEAKVITTGSTVSRYHALVFLVRQAPNNPNYMDYFTIGNSLVLGETNVAPVWEHIRRFMEENGPHLPPGDVLADADVPHTWWQSMRAVFPASKGDTFWGWLKQELPFALLLLALFPLTVPMFILWGTGNWLSHKTATPIRWPDEVRQAVGPVQNEP
ncbi:hypothetical protein GCM10027343_12910 [Noviherbaspirillum agri]